MTNKEKAKNIVGSKPLSSMITTTDFEKLAVEMAEWKDKQFQTAINKTMKYLEKNLQLSEAESEHIRNIFKQSLI